MRKLPWLFADKTPTVAQLSQKVSPTQSLLLSSCHSLFFQPHCSPTLGAPPLSEELVTPALAQAKTWGMLQSRPHKAEQHVAFSGYLCSSSTCTPLGTPLPDLLMP